MNVRVPQHLSAVGRIARDYALILAALAVATWLRLGLSSYLGTHGPYTTYFPVIVFGAWRRGMRGGVITLILSAILSMHFFMSPDSENSVDRSANQAALITFFLSGIAISAIGHSQRAAVRQASEAAALNQKLAERETLIKRMGQAVLDTSDPATLQEDIVNLLGPHLHVDRCFIATYDADRGLVRSGNEWRRPGLQPMGDVHYSVEHNSVLEDLFHSGTAVIGDIRTDLSHESANLMAAFSLRSLIAVPIYRKTELTAVLVVANEAAPRIWNSEEVELTEQVSRLTRNAVETARLNQREHAIASRLQEALQPTVPDQVKGLRLSCFYRSALDEAEVGGDFTDCFSTVDGRTILVVADLSGKGLAAAAQVATVRNMLRFAVYKEKTLRDAVQQLNCIITENGLINGFATLFIASYDGLNHEMRYVNCGQEPGLIWRAATKNVVRLDSTGPILGAFQDSEFDEEIVPLEVGDVFALFTDGLTEAGPSRRELLGIGGVIDVYDAIQPTEDPEAIVKQITDRIIALSDGVVRDDICLLIGSVIGD